MISKIKKIQIFRHITQIVSLFALPGLYLLALEQLKSIYQMIIGGNFDFLSAATSSIELITIIVSTIVIGRFFCGWFCSFGALNDLMYYLNKKIFKVKFKIDPKVDNILKYVKYIVLLFIIVVSWTLGSNILKGTSPWDAFAQITSPGIVISSFAIGLVLLLLISVGAFFIERFFCRYLCPLGAVFSLISRIGIFKINKPSKDCGKCRACTNNCSMGIQLYKVEKQHGGECINCLKCVEVCPRKNANANAFGENINPALASTVAIGAFVGMYGLTNVTSTILNRNSTVAADTTSHSTSSSASNSTTSSSSGSTSSKSSSSSSSSSSSYKDGTYTGTGSGFKGGTTKVKVTVSGGKITDIATVSNGDTPSFYQRAWSTISSKITSSQSASVNTVSGATFSSKGIIEAVTNALSQAV